MQAGKGGEMLIFLDVETTGLEDIDKIVSIGLVASEDDEVEEFYSLVNEGKKIPSLASSINHITNEMIKGKPLLKDTEAYKFLQKHNRPETVIVGHNVKFDLDKLSSLGFCFNGEVIDTLRVTKHLIPECEFFSLGFLRYELKLYRGEDRAISSHNALSDALVVKLLFEYLKDITSPQEMIELSKKNVLLQKFEFGKYRGQFIEEIAYNDRGYLEWMLANLADIDEDLQYSINYYLQG